MLTIVDRRQEEKIEHVSKNTYKDTHKLLVSQLSSAYYGNPFSENSLTGRGLDQILVCNLQIVVWLSTAQHPL